MSQLIIRLLTLISFLVSSNLLFAGDAMTPEWKKILSPLPKDAQTTIKKTLVCYAFGGDELSPEQNKRYNKLNCATVESEIEKIRNKYGSNRKVTEAMNCARGVGSADGGKDCPQE